MIQLRNSVTNQSTSYITNSTIKLKKRKFLKFEISKFLISVTQLANF